jgi:hypothetical protein
MDFFHRIPRPDRADRKPCIHGNARNERPGYPIDGHSAALILLDLSRSAQTAGRDDPAPSAGPDRIR